MSLERLPAHVEAAGILRRVEAGGDFGTIIRRGDAERGALLLVISRRGQHIACLERVLSFDKGYAWQPVGPGESASSADLGAFLDKRARFDEDSWVIELDIAEPERFIAETIRLG
jgi:hypothetical protein